MNLSPIDITKIVKDFADKNILVIGDLMLDAYFWGKTERMSPEAPVPIVEVHKTNFNPGGAGNVALNIAGLGAHSSLMAVVGNDDDGSKLINQLNQSGVDVSSVISLDNYKTPIKTRVIAQEQQLVRIDQENPISTSLELDARIKESLNNMNIKIDGIIIADYNKGFLTKSIIGKILSFAKNKSIPVYVDPKWENYFEYQNIRFFKPNAQEFCKAGGFDSLNINYIEIGKELMMSQNHEILFITRGPDDAILITKDGNEVIPTVSQGVHDVSGAGDTVISVFALADICGASIIESANISNCAASIVCSQAGVVPITKEDLLRL